MDTFFSWLKIFFEKNGIEFSVDPDGFKTEKSHVKFYRLGSPYCIEKGDTFIVWEDEWLFKTHIIKSRLKILFGLGDRIPARVCTVKNITADEADAFLNKNHLQGTAKAKIKLGLFLPQPYQRLLPKGYQLENNLLAVMVFSGQRLFRNGDKSVEIIKFAFHQGLSILGGVSKFISYYEKKYKPDHIMTYIEANTQGFKTFEKLGFRQEGETGSMYFKLDSKNERIRVLEPADIWIQGSLKYVR